jgi:uncharacterized protein YndB with AHSA1/START domain
MSPATQEASDTSIRTTADTSKGTIVVVADIAVPPDRLFRALTDPSEVTKWWGAEGVYRTERFEADLRPGGKWKSVIAAPEGAEMSDARTTEPQTVGGEYIVVDQPHALEFTWSPSWDGFAVTRVRYDIKPSATGSTLTVVHSGFAPESQMAKSHGEGWVRVLGWLSSYVSAA